MRTLGKGTLILLNSFVFLGFSLRLALPVVAAGPDDFDRQELCQLLQGDFGDAAKLESVERPPRVEKTKAIQKAGKSVTSPHLDATPIISWIDPQAKLKAVLVCAHGLGLNKRSYEAFGERLARDGYGVYAMDVRGFGEFQQMPGETERSERRCDFKKCLEDVCQALQLARKMHPGVPVMVLGESMGGAIAMRVTEEHPELVDGLISSVPGADRHKQLQSSLQVGLKLITHGAHAKVDVGKSVVAQSTRKESLRSDWSQDKFARFDLTALELIQFQNFMQANKKNADKISSTPVLMVQGMKDELVKREDTDENCSTFDRIKSQDKELMMVEHAEHLIFEEGQFEDPDIKFVCAWIDKHLSPKPISAAVETK